MTIIELNRFGTELKDPGVAEKEHFPLLERRIRDFPRGTDAVLDFSGVEFIGYAYAKQTVRPCFEKLLGGELRVRSLLLACDRDDYRVYLEAVHLALAESRLSTLLWLKQENRLAPLGYLIYEPPFEGKKEQRKKEKMRRILDLLIARTQLYTNEIAKNLELTLQNSNYLLGELEKMRLVERIKETSPSGGPLYRNRLIFVL